MDLALFHQVRACASRQVTLLTQAEQCVQCLIMDGSRLSKNTNTGAPNHPTQIKALHCYNYFHLDLLYCHRYFFVMIKYMASYTLCSLCMT